MLIALQRLLRPRGYEVMAFSSGSQYLELILGQLPDCLLVDLEMPGCTGLEMVALLRDAGHRPAVVFMTADEPESHEEKVQEAGSVLLTKPFRSAELLEAINESIRTHCP